MAILALLTLTLTAGTAVAAATKTLFFSSLINISNLQKHRSPLIHDRFSQILTPNFFLSILYPFLEKFLHLPLPFSRSQLLELAILNISYLCLSIFFKTSPLILIPKIFNVLIQSIAYVILPGIFGASCFAFSGLDFTPTCDHTGPDAKSDENSNIQLQLSKIQELLSNLAMSQETRLGSSRNRSLTADTPAPAPTPSPTSVPTFEFAARSRASSSSDQQDPRLSLSRDDLRVTGGGGGGQSSSSASSSTNISSFQSPTLATPHSPFLRPNLPLEIQQASDQQSQRNRQQQQRLQTQRTATITAQQLELPDLGDFNDTLRAFIQIPQFRQLLQGTHQVAHEPAADFQLWDNFPQLRDLMAVPAGQPALSADQRSIRLMQNQSLVMPTLPDTLTMQNLREFTLAWASYRKSKGQNSLADAISPAHASTIEIKLRLAEGTLETFVGNQEHLLWQSLHLYFQAVNIEDAEVRLRTLVDASRPQLRLGDIQALTDYLDDFKFHLRCIGEEFLPPHPVICDIYTSGLHPFLQTSLRSSRPTFFLTAHELAVAATLNRSTLAAATASVENLQRHLHSPGGLSGGSPAHTRFCNHCKRTNHDTDRCWRVYPEQRPARLSSPPRDSPAPAVAVAAPTPANASVAPIRESPTPQRRPRNSAIPSSHSSEHVSSSTPISPRQTPARAIQGPANATVPTATSAPAPTATRRITRSMDTNAGGASTSSTRPASMRTQTARRIEVPLDIIEAFLDDPYSTPHLDFPVSQPSSAYRAQHAQSATFTPWPRGTQLTGLVTTHDFDAWDAPIIATEQAQLMAQGFLPNPYVDTDDDDSDDMSDLEDLEDIPESKSTQAGQISEASLQDTKEPCKQSRPAC